MMYSDSRLCATAKLCQLSVLLLATASTASGYVDPAGPVITSPPDAGIVYLRDGTQDVSFWGYVSEGGTYNWHCRSCNLCIGVLSFSFVKGVLIVSKLVNIIFLLEKFDVFILHIFVE
ncbi:unnamed protein product [Clonostachys rosea f. rosea IK726]|uniref:Uncharacterized protein n=1 Tax=Clonostachys rosea f. rosea IK726 TaxID=1349383 RepID=A0ACA9TF74_BIOOC|nr:unnamed protein product [Clonostachys rosea f. rosea IK726]